MKTFAGLAVATTLALITPAQAQQPTTALKVGVIGTVSDAPFFTALSWNHSVFSMLRASGLVRQAAK